VIRNMKGGPSKTTKKKRDDTLNDSENISTMQCQKLSFSIHPVHILRFLQASATDVCQGEREEVMSRFFLICLSGNTWTEEAASVMSPVM